MKSLLGLLVALHFSMPCGLAKNRVQDLMSNNEGDKAPGMRCMKEALPADKCDSHRKKAVATGCINQEEHDTLQKYGAYPMCDSLEDDPEKVLKGWCFCGCFHPDTLIRAIDQTGSEVLVNAGSIAETPAEFQLVHLLGGQYSGTETTYSPIRLSTKGQEFEALYVIQTKDKRVLKLTSRHPVLLRSGKMVLASDLRAGDELVDLSGKKVKIQKITREKTAEQVVNFSVEAKTNREHVIFANDLAVGDQYWQAALEDEIGRISVRM